MNSQNLCFVAVSIFYKHLILQFFKLIKKFWLVFSLAPKLLVLKWNNEGSDHLTWLKLHFWYTSKYFWRFFEKTFNIFSSLLVAFGLPEFVYILGQCYQLVFLYCKIGQIHRSVRSVRQVQIVVILFCGLTLTIIQ